MYEDYSRQALPNKRYRELLGSSICAFNSNNAFIIETILRLDDDGRYTWYRLIDMESGKVLNDALKPIKNLCGEQIYQQFGELVKMRNRIIHSFQITDSSGEQILATKEQEKNGNRQFHITEKYLLDFIEKNEALSDCLHQLRGC